MRAQDILIACKLAVKRPAVNGPTGLTARSPTLQALARELGLSVSDVHGALRRNEAAGLSCRGVAESVPEYKRAARAEGYEVRTPALHEFLIHGLPYVFPARRSALTMGMPTALSETLDPSSRDRLPVVWPVADGSVQGESLAPLHKSVPYAASRDARLHSLMSAIDVLRLGDAMLRPRAIEQITVLLGLDDTDLAR
jgi:hypothetical protein